MLVMLVLAFAGFLGTSYPALAVNPDEMLADPALEARARVISKQLRCLVCRNENIDDSNAGLAKDIRLLVRERLTKGDTNDQVVAYIVNRYGEYVLLKPTLKGANIILWLAGPALLLISLLIAVLYMRRRSNAAETEALSPQEQAQLEKILKG